MMARAERRRLMRASERYEARGCHRCGQRHPRAWAWQDGAGRLRLTCERCTPAVTGGPRYAVDTGRTFIETDAEWFAARPGVDHRLREPQPGEWVEWHAQSRLTAAAVGRDPNDAPLPAADDLVLVVQLRPGERVRLPFERTAPPPSAADAASLRFRLIEQQRHMAALLPGDDALRVLAAMTAEAAFPAALGYPIEPAFAAMAEARQATKH